MAEINTTGVETAAERRQKQLVEYGTYVATEPISINGAHAFNAGDPVPVSHVEAFPDLLAQGFVKPREAPKSAKQDKPST